ncbi:MAG: hypothetical protein WCW02_04500 [Candidatus Buchananbacteria bacterium]
MVSKAVLKRFYVVFGWLGIAGLAVVVWYSPLVFKGYNATITASDNLVRARNFAYTGRYATENQLNVVLAPELIKDQAVTSNYGNKWGSIFYGYLIRWVHPSSNQAIIFINCIILALALLVFTIAIYYTWGSLMAFIFALVYIFLPTNWSLAQMLVDYELALLFFALFLLFFSFGTKKFSSLESDTDNFKFFPQGLWLIVAGIFLILAGVAKEAFFIILPILFGYLLLFRLKQYLVYVFATVVILWSVLWLPGFLAGQNTYLLFFTSHTTESLKSSDYSYYAHLFPDPYIYHFDRDNFLKQKLNFSGSDAMWRLGREKVLANMGQGEVNLWQRLKIGTALALRHVFRFFSITEIGGPLITLLLILGWLALKKRSDHWFNFSCWWVFGSIVLISYVTLAGRNHLMDFGWLIALGVASGVLFLSDVLAKYFMVSKKAVIIVLTLLTIYDLIICSHVMWGQAYDNSPMIKLNYYFDKIAQANLRPDEVIASGTGVDEIYNLNFNTNKSIVAFRPETIERLLAENKLEEVFVRFGVKAILGYSPELSQKIIGKTKAGLIADDVLPSQEKVIKVNNQNWFMNLVR